METPEAFFIITEYVRPLATVIADTDVVAEASQLWGLHCTATTLHFLHSSCNTAHNNVSPHSIFVTKVRSPGYCGTNFSLISLQAGDWRLGGFELSCNVDAPDSYGSKFQKVEHILPEGFRSPERVRKQYQTLGRAGAHGASGLS